jgi:hypothetical protein
MSTLDGSPVFGSEEADGSVGRPTEVGRLIARALQGTLERAAFWTAVTLPFLYVPLLVGGVTTSGEQIALAVLLALNAVALYVGHGHDP